MKLSELRPGDTLIHKETTTLWTVAEVRKSGARLLSEDTPRQQRTVTKKQLKGYEYSSPLVPVPVNVTLTYDDKEDDQP